MSYLSLLRFALITSIFTTAFGSAIQNFSSSISQTCNQIAKSISSASDVYLPGSTQYNYDNYHWASSSSEVSVCTVEPGTPQDVGIILQILGKTKTPFGVKGGGHSYNVDFSSTTGVQISLTRFNQINVNKTAQTAEIGMGLNWDEVYGALDPLNTTVIGGRVTGVGVAGFALGGGLSYKTNQYGIATANIVALELVLPSGKVVSVSENSYPDLFFAVRGAQNNYGIVTSVTMKTMSQGLVWGGPITYALNSSSTITSLQEAYQDFQENVKDKKAVMNVVVFYNNGDLMADAILFYDAPEPPSGVYDKFLAIPSVSSDLTTKTYAETTLVLNGNSTSGERIVFDHRMVQNYPPALFNAILNESMYWGAEAAKIDSNASLSYIMEFFDSDYLQHGDTGSWPPNGNTSPALLPMCLQWNWISSKNDSWFKNAQSQSFNNLARVMAQLGMPNLPRYSNYALGSTTAVQIWGKQNLARLQKIQAQYDPNNVMGLTGGFKV